MKVSTALDNRTRTTAGREFNSRNVHDNPALITPARQGVHTLLGIWPGYVQATPIAYSVGHTLLPHHPAHVAGILQEQSPRDTATRAGEQTKQGAPGTHPPGRAKRPMKVCAQSGCPELTPQGRYCPTHTQAREQARGTTTQRGYGNTHQQLRNKYAALLRNISIPCARCGSPIHPGDPWDLGHTDTRNAWTGPEHASCNRAAGGHASH